MQGLREYYNLFSSLIGREYPDLGKLDRLRVATAAILSGALFVTVLHLYSLGALLNTFVYLLFYASPGGSGGGVQCASLILRESNHRIKNNLSMILSLINLESAGLPPGNRTVREALKQRITAVGFFHESLYRGGDYVNVDLAAYLTELARRISRMNESP